MIDSHTHLELCEPPDNELVAAATAVGVTDESKSRSPRAGSAIGRNNSATRSAR